MAGRSGQWTVLPPTRHATIDQATVPLTQHFWAQAESLHDTGTEALDQYVSISVSFRHCSLPAALLRSSSRTDLPRSTTGFGQPLPPGRSTRNMAAPISLSSIAASGPGQMLAIYTTVTPVSGPSTTAPLSLLIVGPSLEQTTSTDRKSTRLN